MKLVKLATRIGCILAIVLITSCSPQEEIPPSKTSEHIAEITLPSLKIAVNAGPEGEAINELVGSYDKATVEIVELPYQSLREQLLTLLSDGRPDFDIVMVDDPWFPQLASHLAQLRNVPQQLLNDIVPASLALSKDPYSVGELRALPFVGNTQLLFYRKDILIQFGVHSVPKDWRALEALVSKISKSDSPEGSPPVYGYAIRGRSGAPLVTDFLPVFWSMGGSLVDDRGNPKKQSINDETFIESLKLYKQLQSASPPGAINFDWSEMTAAYINGQAVFQLNWPAAIPMIEDAIPNSPDTTRWAVALPPGMNGKPGTSMIGNWLLAIPEDSAHLEQAEQLIIWLMERQGSVAASGNPPTRISVFNTLAAEPGKEYFEIIHRALEKSTPRVRSPKWDQIEESVSRSVSAYLVGDLTENEALDQLKVEIAKYLNDV